MSMAAVQNRDRNATYAHMYSPADFDCVRILRISRIARSNGHESSQNQRERPTKLSRESARIAKSHYARLNANFDI